MEADGRQRVRALVVSPYWGFWEPSVTTVDLRDERRRQLAAACALLEEEGVSVLGQQLVDDATDPVQVIDDQVIDVALLVVTMAAQPGPVLGILEALPPGTPVVLWAMLLPELGTTGAEEIVRNGATVGTPLVTAALSRRGRDFEVVAGPRSPEVAGRVSQLCRALTLARCMPGITLARIGAPMPGYEGVDAPDDALERAFGLSVRHISPEEVAHDARAVTRAQLATARASLPASHDGDPPGLEPSLRLAVALDELSTRDGISCGAMNCHNEALRHSTDLGVTPCYGLGAQTSAGRPWTCTGDVLTAVAMLVAKRLSGAALYHEVESLDPGTGQAILANSGEYDLAWVGDPTSVVVRENPWYLSDPTVGVSVSHDLRAGPATLVGVAHSPDHASGFRLVAAAGQVVAGDHPELPTAGGSFLFGGPDPIRSWEAWIRAGATHHAALALGDIREGVRAMAALLGLDQRTIPSEADGA